MEVGQLPSISITLRFGSAYARRPAVTHPAGPPLRTKGHRKRWLREEGNASNLPDDNDIDLLRMTHSIAEDEG